MERPTAEEISAAIKGLGMGTMTELELCLCMLTHLKHGTSRKANAVATAARQVLRLRGDCLGNA